MMFGYELVKVQNVKEMGKLYRVFAKCKTDLTFKTIYINPQAELAKLLFLLHELTLRDLDQKTPKCYTYGFVDSDGG